MIPSLSSAVFPQDTPPPIIPTPARKLGDLTVLTNGLSPGMENTLTGSEGDESAFQPLHPSQKPHVSKSISEAHLSPYVQTALNRSMHPDAKVVN